MQTRVNRRAAALIAIGSGSAQERSAWLRRFIVPPVAIFAVTRILLELLFANGHRLLPGPRIRGNASVLPHNDLLWAAGSWTRPWFRFDTAWYVGVAEHGYHWATAGQANTNFLPLYPALIRMWQPVFFGSPWLSAWVVSNVCCLAAFVLLWRWALVRLPEECAMRALVLIALFPFAFFLSTPYAEPLFVALAVAAFILAEEDRWGWALTAAGLSTITRPVGLAVVLGLATMSLFRGDARRAAVSLLAALPLAGFAVYLAVSFGRPFAFLVSHSYGWARPSGGLLHTVAIQFHTKLSPFDRVDAALAVLFLASAYLVWRRLGPGYAVFVIVGVLLPLVHGLIGIERYVIVLFPTMAAWASIERRGLQAGLLAVSVLGLFLGTLMYAVGYTLT